MISGDEVRFTVPEGEENQTAELLFTSAESGLSLNGTYFEGCCDRYVYYFTDVGLSPLAGRCNGIFVPGVARTTGENGSVWRSAVVFFNPLARAIDIEVTYISEGKDPRAASITFELEPGATYFVGDSLVDNVTQDPLLVKAQLFQP